MTEDSVRPAVADPADVARFEELAARLVSRWPESRIGPSLSRIQRLVDLLGNPERACPVIQITGTNGKGSTAIMIEALLRSAGLRVGRYSSPHLQQVNERIAIDGVPLPPADFVRIYEEIEPMVAMVDQEQIDGISMTFFEVMTGLAYAAFADAPVDVAVIEVGLGGTWDATNVATAEVAVITPIDLDHTHLLGSDVAGIAAEKSGIIKEGSHVVMAGQRPDAAEVLLARAASVGADVVVEGVDFGLVERTPGVAGQVLRLQTPYGVSEDVALPIFGVHMADNAALALTAVQTLLANRELGAELIRDGFAQVEAPGRLEVVRRSPLVVLDSGHNPHAVRAAVAGLLEAFELRPLVVVLAMMRDKDQATVLEVLAPIADRIVVTELDTDRGLPAADLAVVAHDWFSEEQISVEPQLADALDRAVGLADEDGVLGGVLVIGSVILAGAARDLLVGRDGLNRSTVAVTDDEADGVNGHDDPLLELGASWGEEDTPR